MPWAEGDAQNLGQAPDVVTEDISQVAKDGKLGFVLADVFVHEGGRRRPYTAYAKTHTVELG